MKAKIIKRVIKDLFGQDQADRLSKRFLKLSPKRRFILIGRRDRRRINALKSYQLERYNLSEIDYFRAGLIFHHGGTLSDLLVAKTFAEKGSKLNHKKSKWLFAAVIDRILVIQGKKQKYGTQLRLNNSSLWELWPVNPKIKDSARRKVNVLPLAKISRIILLLNGHKGKHLLSSTKIGLTFGK